MWINSGTYNAKVTVNFSKPNVTFQGQGFESKIIVWNNSAKNTGTFYSATVDVFATGFVAKNINFKNASPAPKPGDRDGQAVAIRVSGDQAAFWDCGMYSYQDTLFDDLGRHYFSGCFIEGSIVFIFGNGRSFYEKCILNSVATGDGINGAICAQGREYAADDTGFAFVNCRITGSGLILLGRATVFYGEYMCTGVGDNMTGRVPYAKSLTEQQAQIYLDASYVDADGWLKPFNDSLAGGGGDDDGGGGGGDDDDDGGDGNGDDDDGAITHQPPRTTRTTAGEAPDCHGRRPPSRSLPLKLLKPLLLFVVLAAGFLAATALLLGSAGASYGRGAVDTAIGGECLAQHEQRGAALGGVNGATVLAVWSEARQ
uniref:pectinesterase n=1 Tax=Oryza meridionalis TaxID=40149 RepID=A0A0E0CPY3_9ORYZ